MLQRSTYFADRIAEFDRLATADKKSRVPSVHPPDCDVQTFTYYKQCVDSGTTGVSYTAATIDEAIDAYIKGHHLATELGDCRTANLIIDSLIAYTVLQRRIFLDRHVQRIYEFDRRPSNPLLRLAVDLYAYAARYEEFQCRVDFGRLPAEFLMDVLVEKTRVQSARGGERVEEAFEYGFIAGEAGRYWCYGELHPRPLE